MNKRLAAAICIIGIVLIAATASAESGGFDHSVFLREGMIGPNDDHYLYGEDYIYSYSTAADGWQCGLMTMGEPYLLFYVQGDTNGRETMIQIDAAFDLPDNSASATVVEFITDDLVHTLELTSSAQANGLEGFPIYKANYNIIKELALCNDFSVRAYVDGDTYDLEMSDAASGIICDMAHILASQKVMKYYSSDFSGEDNVQKMNNFIAYSINSPADLKKSIVPQYPSSAYAQPSTIGETNALRKAKQYLDVMPFSYSGLIDQLEYEGYSHSEAVYGADNCGANWYEQAAMKAEDYLDLMPFSRSGLIEQLEYDGFTYDQAVYGAAQNGY